MRCLLAKGLITEDVAIGPIVVSLGAYARALYDVWLVLGTADVMYAAFRLSGTDDLGCATACDGDCSIKRAEVGFANTSFTMTTSIPVPAPTPLPVPSPTSSYCALGVATNAGQCCADDACEGTCGGSGCSAREGGGALCCSGTITDAGVCVLSRSDDNRLSCRDETGTTCREFAILLAVKRSDHHVMRWPLHHHPPSNRYCSSPSDVGCLIPPYDPTLLPLPAPTSLPVPAPTSMPMPSPTSVPVPSPTSVPVPSPTSVPVPIPSPAPSALPTRIPEEPSAVPIPAPSAVPVPAPTSVSIPAPTPAPRPPAPTVVPFVDVSLTLGLSGLACADYGSAEESAVNTALAEQIGGGVDAADFDEHVCTDDDGIRRRRDLLSSAISIETAVSIESEAYGAASSGALASSVASSFAAAVSSGGFTASVASAAAEAGLTTLAGVAVTTASAVAAAPAPSFAPTAVWCDRGLTTSNVCCADADQCDGKCGGSGCAARPGGSSLCCFGKIRNTGV